MKIVNAFLFVIIIYGILPINLISRFYPDKYFEMIITGQEKGCLCPGYIVLNGEVIIPDSIKVKYKNLYEKEIDLVEGSLSKNYNYELAHSKIHVKGKVVGVNQFNNDEYSLLYEVYRWKIKSYIPNFLTWSKWIMLTYLIISLLGIIIISYRLLRKF